METKRAGARRHLRLLGAAALALGLIGAPHAMAASEAIDYADMFKTKIFPCIHPSVKLDTVTAEVRKPPVTSGDITTTRVQAYYQGMIKKNSVEADVMVRQSGSIRQIKINVLSDTSMLHGSCELTKDWKDF